MKIQSLAFNYPKCRPHAAQAKAPLKKDEFILSSQRNPSFGRRLFKGGKVCFISLKPKKNYRLTKDEIRNILINSKDLTLDTPTLIAPYYGAHDLYDLPLKFASAAYNSKEPYIVDEMPEIFKNLDSKELLSALDDFSFYYRKRYNPHFPIGLQYEVNLAGKDFLFETVDCGMEGSVYRIYGDKGSVIMKNYFTDFDKYSPYGVTFAPCGIYGSVGILREANRAGVKDVAKLYLSNPTYTKIGTKFSGGWSITQDAETKEVEDGLTIREWLFDKGLFNADDKESSWVRGTCVDLGFIVNRAKEMKGYYHCGWGDELANEIYSGYIEGKTTQELIDSLQG